MLDHVLRGLHQLKASTGPETLDLMGDFEVTTSLLMDPLAWRVRAVERADLDSANSCYRSRSLQCAPLAGLLLTDRQIRMYRDALVVLNVAAMPRGPLHEFDLEGPIGPAFLLPRVEIASREAHFLRKLAADAGLRMSESVATTIEFALGYSADQWRDELVAGRYEEFLADGTSMAFPQATIRAWEEISLECHAVLSERTRAPDGLPTATHDPLLVIPELVGSGSCTTNRAIERALIDYRNFLVATARAANPDSPTGADDLLGSLADYGAYYDLLVATRVPLHEPFMLKYRERRSLDFKWPRRTAEQELVAADAQTNHVSFVVTDASIEIRALNARRTDSQELAFGAFAAAHETPQAYSFYGYSQDREYRLRASIKLAALRRLQLVPYLATVLMLALTLVLINEQVSRLPGLALVAAPSALAATILLARDPSSLGARLRATSSAGLVAATIMMLVAAGLLYAGVDLHGLVFA